MTTQLQPTRVSMAILSFFPELTQKTPFQPTMSMFRRNNSNNHTAKELSTFFYLKMKTTPVDVLFCQQFLFIKTKTFSKGNIFKDVPFVCSAYLVFSQLSDVIRFYELFLNTRCVFTFPYYESLQFPFFARSYIY